MPLFTVTDACTGCGLCAKACPASLVRQKEAGERPVPLPGREAHCIRCGHCVAVCKPGAFVHALLPAADFESVSRDRLPSFESVRHLLMARRSCRMYAGTPLAREEILGLIEAVRHAPTGHNVRGIGYVVVDGPERLDEVREVVLDWMRLEVAAGTRRAAVLHLEGAIRAVSRGKDVVFRGAPQVVVVHAPTDGVTPQADAVIAGAWLELAAAAKGYGACWCGYLMFALAGHRPMGELLGIGQGRQGYAALLLGRPAVRPVSIPPREMPDIRFF
jgi:nitroreductase/NAD-dependent dihydropyrimidine dehydrogenase PreA subunit